METAPGIRRCEASCGGGIRYWTARQLSVPPRTSVAAEPAVRSTYPARPPGERVHPDRRFFPSSSSSTTRARTPSSREGRHGKAPAVVPACSAARRHRRRAERHSHRAHAPCPRFETRSGRGSRDARARGSAVVADGYGRTAGRRRCCGPLTRRPRAAIPSLHTSAQKHFRSPRQ